MGGSASQKIIQCPYLGKADLGVGACPQKTVRVLSYDSTVSDGGNTQRFHGCAGPAADGRRR
jgi:hypothetical protein